jgi:hypothetical protein
MKSNYKVGDKVKFIGGTPSTENAVNNSWAAKLQLNKIYEVIRAEDNMNIMINDKLNLWYNSRQFEPVTEEFKLPSRWCIKRTEETWKKITDYLNENCDRSYSYYNSEFPWITNNTNHNESESEKPKDAIELSFEEFNRYILKKETIMKSKENFQISGSKALKMAFLEECDSMNIPMTPGLKKDFKSKTDYIQNHTLLGNYEKWLGYPGSREDKVKFNLPEDYLVALDYVKNYYKEEEKFKFKVGDEVVVLNNKYNGDFKIGTVGKITKIIENGKTPYKVQTSVDYWWYNGIEDLRLATKEELLPKIKTLVLGDQKLKIVISRSNEIQVEGKELRIDELRSLLEVMNGENCFDADGWDVTFSSAKIGCCTFTKAELQLILNTYDTLND